MTIPQFRTPTGAVVPGLTAEEMAAIDRVAMADFHLSLEQMMENAGRALASHLLDAGAESILVLAGNGGNGGGGLVAARHLVNRGSDVRIVFDRPPTAISGIVAKQRAILEAMGVPMTTAEDVAADPTTYIIDALIGYGLQGPVRGTVESLIRSANRTAATVISLDVPSGLDATTGSILGHAVEPAATVTVALPKRGLHGHPAPVFLADIAIPLGVYEQLGIETDRPFTTDSLVELTPL